MTSLSEASQGGLRHVVGSLLEAVPWAARTERLLALKFDFGVRTNDPELGDHLDTILGQFASPGDPAHWYSILDRGRGPRRYALYFDDDRVIASSRASVPFSRLLWHINRKVVESSSDYLLFHASAAEHDGTALLFPAPRESGKTTLVAGLVRAGLRYVTDEAVALDLASMTVQPFPKALAVDAGSWTVLADLEPRVPDAVAAYLGSQWQVAPRAIRANAIASQCHPGFVILPRYDARTATELVPISAAETVVGLAENSFNFGHHGHRGLAAVADLVRQCGCYRLTVSDLGAACALVVGLLESPRGRS